jgi:hypothetical protein
MEKHIEDKEKEENIKRKITVDTITKTNTQVKDCHHKMASGFQFKTELEYRE